MQYVTNTDGKKTGVLISLKEYQKFLRVQEELEDTQDFDKAIEENDWVSLEDVKKDIGI